MLIYQKILNILRVKNIMDMFILFNVIILDYTKIDYMEIYIILH